ncbi:FecR family protein [Salinibacter altiplanensis]|uniref:FecR family protein n=1 Tax=Salinibacter altiplanensis TaxID=1803181 RepID=UPI000C9EDFD5|nr:FecR domain-containing protein [Salinibacter altiplanensis]
MDDAYGPLLFEDDLSPEQRAKLQERLDDDPALADGWAHWRQVRVRLRERLQTHLPDRRLLVLYALDRAGRGDLLTPEEAEVLEAARDDIAEAIDAVPSLRRVVARVQNEQADFETVWAQHHEEIRAVRGEAGRRSRPDRGERPPRRPEAPHGATSEHQWAWRLTVAALLLGAAALAVLYGPQGAERTTVTVESGEQRRVEFEDGSTVRLAGVSTLSYTPGMSTAEKRRVTLARGQAYFDVAAQDDAPFVVTTPAARTEVLGTQFGVAAGNDTTEVVLVDGRVRLGPGESDEAEPVVLAPGERSMVRTGEAPTSPAPVDLSAALDWTGLFVFRATPVSTIAERLREHYGVSISVAPALAEEPVTGTFRQDRSVEQVLNTIARTLGADVRKEAQGYRLEPAS